VARVISIVPGLGQLYYGAPKRALQYLGGVVLSGLGAALVYNLSFDLAHLGISPALTSIGFLVSELAALTLVISAVCFWIAASWDARQGTIALNQQQPYHPTWWFVKVKRFLFDDPAEEEGHE
jgi:hypothetical protein